MKQIRVLIATMLLVGIGGGAYFLSDWSDDVPHVVAPEVSVTSLDNNILQSQNLGKCPFQVDSVCYTCESPEAFFIESEEECAKCPKRQAIYTGGAEIASWVCALVTCPKTHPIHAENGNCFACDETRAINYFPEDGDTGANLCPNRVLNAGALALKQCPSSHPLIDPLGGCYACDEAQDVYTTSENCAGCANRSFEPMNKVGRCYVH